VAWDLRNERRSLGMTISMTASAAEMQGSLCSCIVESEEKKAVLLPSAWFETSLERWTAPFGRAFSKGFFLFVYTIAGNTRNRPA